MSRNNMVLVHGWIFRHYWKKLQLSTPTIPHLMSLLTGCILLGVKQVSFTQWEHIDKREQQIGSNNELGIQG